tara:strand:+ start:1263 stop:1895 length:633 start_codon:yes stop_codon:yes gene_type:complete
MTNPTTRRAVLGFAGAIAALSLLGAGAAQALDSEQQAEIARVEAYLNGIQSLSARFVQIGPNGELARGQLYMRRPGRLRFEYEPPTPILIVADGLWLVMQDKELGQVNRFPLYETPLGVLVAKTVDLSDGVEVRRVERQAGILRVTVIDSDRPDEGSLTIAFSDPPLLLRQWQVLDARGGVTHVALTDIRVNLPLKPELFTFIDPPAFQR